MVKAKGVSSATVTQSTNSATVKYNPKETTPAQLAQVVDSAKGMSPYHATVKQS